MLYNEFATKIAEPYEGYPAWMLNTFGWGMSIALVVVAALTSALPGDPDHQAHGIRGMRERAELYGGVLTAGPTAGGGFGVVLRLPMGEVAAR